MNQQKTWTPKGAEALASRQWHLIDAEGQTLGRIAVLIARLLRGKHKPNFTPHLDVGDYVVVINAAKVTVTGNKLRKKMYYRHSNYPGGFRAVALQDYARKHPTRPLEEAVRGMLPRNNMGDNLFRKLHVYAGPAHKHEAQNPTPYDMGLAADETGQHR
ncbi:MAG: 50S ribosomal protein L13 [Chloroflexia bacterium]